MSEARAVTNFAGNAVATLVIGCWVGEFDRARAGLVLEGELPFDETTSDDDAAGPGRASEPEQRCEWWRSGVSAT